VATKPAGQPTSSSNLEREVLGAQRSNGARRSRKRPEKASEQIAQQIVHDIVARGLRTGDRLPLEAEMVEQYGFSRSSLREGLRLLEVQGLIRIKPGPGGGPVVGSVSAVNFARTSTLYFHLAGSTYAELLDTQLALEPLCAELAARHPNRRTAMKPFLPNAMPETEDEYRDVTNSFHQVVYDLAGNSVLCLLAHAITEIVTEHVVSTMDPVQLRPQILREHAEIATAIAAGQRHKARNLMSEHFAVQHDHYRRTAPQRLADLIEWR
jgi:DNA-binding FadR family transcriptional regulator